MDHSEIGLDQKDEFISAKIQEVNYVNQDILVVNTIGFLYGNKICIVELSLIRGIGIFKREYNYDFYQDIDL